MGWCPSCGYEYRPEVQQCPNCGLALTPEPPADIPRVAGLRVEAKTARLLSPFTGLRAGFAAGLQLARTAARITYPAKKLLVVVALLATIGLAGDFVLGNIYVQRVLHSASGRQFPTPSEEGVSLLNRWFAVFQARAPLSYLLQDFYSPVEKVAYIADPWLFTIALLIQPQGFAAPAARFAQTLSLSLLTMLESVATTALGTLFLAGLLGWLKAIAAGTPPQPWRAYLKAHYRPLFLLAVCIILGLQLILLPAELTQSLVTDSPGWRNTLDNVTHFIFFGVIVSWILPLVFLALTLAPFSIVGRNLGAWGGVKAGARSLWQHRWIALGLLVIYRVIHEAVNLLGLRLSSVPYIFGYEFRLWSLFGYWVMYLAFAFLGLWLALAFTMLVAAEKPLEQAAESTG